MKTRTIRVEEEVYQALKARRDWQESFSHVISRLLKVYDTIKGVSDTLGPGHPLQDIKRYRGNAEEAAKR